MGVTQLEILHFVDENLPTARRFFDSSKISGEGELPQHPPVTTRLMWVVCLFNVCLAESCLECGLNWIDSVPAAPWTSTTLTLYTTYVMLSS